MGVDASKVAVRDVGRSKERKYMNKNQTRAFKIPEGGVRNKFK